MFWCKPSFSSSYLNSYSWCLSLCWFVDWFLFYFCGFLWLSYTQNLQIELYYLVELPTCVDLGLDYWKNWKRHKTRRIDQKAQVLLISVPSIQYGYQLEQKIIQLLLKKFVEGNSLWRLFEQRFFHKQCFSLVYFNFRNTSSNI